MATAKPAKLTWKRVKQPKRLARAVYRARRMKWFQKTLPLRERFWTALFAVRELIGGRHQPGSPRVVGRYLQLPAYSSEPNLHAADAHAVFADLARKLSGPGGLRRPWFRNWLASPSMAESVKWLRFDLNRYVSK